ncbi:MAG: ribosomal protein [Gammaproteobacteria bacterium]|jgi:large subunit ribosomal protein L33|nr:ribosomal protein [Gammaproteobacteria bacterium]
MAKKGRQIVELRSTESDHWYMTTKNPKKTTGKLKIKKFDPKVRKHVMYEEGKVKK